MSARGRVVLGSATTAGQVMPLGADDPVIAARAVRRALAAAGRHAIDVDAFAVATTEPLTDEVLAMFARRALGPHGADVRRLSVSSGEHASPALADAAAEALPGDDRGGVAIAAGIAADGTTVALCVSGPGAQS